MLHANPTHVAGDGTDATTNNYKQAFHPQDYAYLLIMI